MATELPEEDQRSKAPAANDVKTWLFQDKTVSEFMTTHLNSVPDTMLKQNIPLPRCNNVVIDVKFAPFCTLTRSWLLSHMVNVHVVDGFAAVICHTRNPSSTQLMFPNSSLVFIGCPSKEESWLAVQKVRMALYAVGNTPNFDRLSVNNQVYDVKVGFYIDLPALSKDTTLFVIWKRKIFPGAFLQDMKRRIRHLVFDSGKVVSMSSKSSDVVHEGWLELYEVLLRYKTGKPLKKKPKKKGAKDALRNADESGAGSEGAKKRKRAEGDTEPADLAEDNAEAEDDEDEDEADASARGNASLSALGMLSDLTGTAETQQEAHRRVEEFSNICKKLMKQGDTLPVARKKALKAMQAKEASELAEKRARERAEAVARAELGKDKEPQQQQQQQQQQQHETLEQPTSVTDTQATSQKELQRTARELREAVWTSVTRQQQQQQRVPDRQEEEEEEEEEEEGEEEVITEGTV